MSLANRFTLVAFEEGKEWYMLFESSLNYELDFKQDFEQPDKSGLEIVKEKPLKKQGVHKPKIQNPKSGFEKLDQKEFTNRVRGEMQYIGFEVHELAQSVYVSAERLTRILNCKVKITEQQYLDLCRIFGID